MSHPAGPATPAFILRGHAFTVHALHFFASNAYLASADSDGWLVVWSLASKRAVAVWKAHASGILGIKDWDEERLITHGRDHKLRVWKVGKQDLEELDASLPIDGAETSIRKEPWLLHSMDVNALNFCAFAMCNSAAGQQSLRDADLNEPAEAPENAKFPPILIATPNALDSGGIDIFQLPTERRVSTISSDKTTTTGMVMALSMLSHPTTGHLIVISGYEDGQTIVHIRSHELPGPWLWRKVLLSKPHSQPLLSIDVSPKADVYYTSSADATIAKFAIPILSLNEILKDKPMKMLNTKHAGQQGLSVRSDGKIFATAGWDSRIRVYSGKTMKELAVLKWHKEGCYAVAFAYVAESDIAECSQSAENVVMQKRNALDLIRTERDAKAQITHWLAAGGKDAKISLWEMY